MKVKVALKMIEHVYHKTNLMKGKFFAYPMSSQMPETVLVVGLAQKTIVSKSRQLEKMRRHK